MWWWIKAQWADWREYRRLRCIIDEEWCGVFIGRRYCARHNTRWDDGGLCPKQEVGHR